MSEYIRLCEGTVETKGKLIGINEDILSLIDSENPSYASIFVYNEAHASQFKTSGTIRGITDVYTNKLVFDFDSKDDIGAAQKDCVELCNRLTRHGVDKADLQICFSGFKGFSVEVTTDKRFTPEEFRSINLALTEGLTTNDIKIANASRVFRIPQTKHDKSGLYKFPLTLTQLRVLSVEEIKVLATDLSHLQDDEDFRWGVVSLTDDILKLKDYIPKIVKVQSEVTLKELTLVDKPKWLTNCRYAILNGFFEEGDRNFSLLCLAATFRNQGMPEAVTYRALKGAAELQSKRYNCSRYPDSQIYNNIVTQVYSDGWKGGQFSCREPGNDLYTYCQSLGDKKCSHDHSEETKPKRFLDLTESFEDYVKNIDKNTIKTGIVSLDKALFLSTGISLGVVAAPGVGKTSLALNILNNTSKVGIKSVFASLDMHRNRMYEKVLYKLTGANREELYSLFKTDSKRKEEILEKLQQEFGNVFFYDRSSPTVADIREYILDCQEQCGEKIKLVMLDYFERVTSDVSEDTAASKKIAGQLQDMVNDLGICLITLVQPNKMSLGGDASNPIHSYTAIKGSSFLCQSFRAIISLWRPFYNPKDFSNDKYMQMAILKNDLGELAELAFKWHGKKGEIYEMEDSDYDDLGALLKEKEEKKTPAEGW